MNRVELIGRLTKDLEPRQTQSGSTLLRFTLAVNRQKKAEGQQDADFVSCRAFGKTADNMARYLHKGSQLAVEGRIETGSYTNQQGQKVYTTDVICERVEFLDSRESRQEPAQSYGYGQTSYPAQTNGYDQASEKTADPYGDLPF